MSIPKYQSLPEIIKVKIEDDEHVLLDTTQAKEFQSLAICTKLRSKPVLRHAVELPSWFHQVWLISNKTNTCYTLWWNMGPLQEMYIQNRAHRPNDNVMFMGPTKWQ